jgi:hypothetical protein
MIPIGALLGFLGDPVIEILVVERYVQPAELVSSALAHATSHSSVASTAFSQLAQTRLQPVILPSGWTSGSYGHAKRSGWESLRVDVEA